MQFLKKTSENSVKFQQRYKNSHRIFHNLLCSKIFGISPAPKIDACLVGQFWGLNTFRILQARPPKSRTLPECVSSRGLSDAQIQLISGHESKKSLEIYEHTSSLGAVEQAYQEAAQGVSI